ncbi:hypothetical protein Mgra_00006699 [Meloidogyne graminicola]|uniref:Uncharacterized protein n=1 Tax=Meloidogyne graminicola TaxID=189291 RepID=A0A8S9ZKZ6_9BILA|nr:hypothetical protein Mgra_00006699 [Meloidogyne graminicola]
MVFLSFVFLLAITITISECNECSDKQGSITFLKDSFTGSTKTERPEFSKITTICTNKNVETHCYDQNDNKLSLLNVICSSSSVCVCNYDDGYCYQANKTASYILNYLFYSYDGYMFVNPNTGGQELVRTDGKKHYQHKTSSPEFMNLVRNSTSYINGKDLLGKSSLNFKIIIF